MVGEPEIAVIEAYLELQTPVGPRRVDSGGLLIGRAQECGLLLNSRAVSSRHAMISCDDAGWWIEDQGSLNGTRLDGRPIEARTRLGVGVAIELGDQRLSIRAIRHASTGPSPDAKAWLGVADTGSSDSSNEVGVLSIPLREGIISIGRDKANDVVLKDRNVSRFHAELEVHGSRYELRDLGSCNGTRLGGELVKRATVTDGSEIGVGRSRIVLSATEVRAETGAARIIANGIRQQVHGGRCILRATNLQIAPGELVALIGEAGSGKSTLLKILAGVSKPSEGSVLVDGESLSLRLPEVGYLPQADILHPGLTAREALQYGARLRLPPDTTRSEIHVIVDRTLRELELEAHADTKIGALSGGQQRRVGIAMELLGSPRLLFLDEPGANLDVRLEGQLISVLRRVARRNCAVVAITHRTTFLEQFDRLLVMGAGGVLWFDGPPQAARLHFGVSDFDVIYERVAEREVPKTSEKASVSSVSPTVMPTDGVPETLSHRRSHQCRVLAGRSALVLTRDRRNLAFLIVQAPVLAAGAALLFGSDAFALTSGAAEKSALFLYVLAVIATWIGTTDGARALITERAIFIRERSLGVGAVPYLASKMLVLGALGLAQAALLTTVAFAVAPPHCTLGAVAAIAVLLVLATFAALSIGLLLSALVATEDQSSSLLPLLLVPQVLCAGAIVSVKNMGVLEPLAAFMSSRWAFAGTGSALALEHRSSATRGFLHYYGTFFNIPWVLAATILLTFIGVITTLTGCRLHSAWRR